MVQPKQPPPGRHDDASNLPNTKQDTVTRKIRGDDPDDEREGVDVRTQYERDQSSDSTGDEPREIMRQAKRDIDRGLVDTDLRGTPGMDAERQEELLKQEKARTSGNKPKP